MRYMKLTDFLTQKAASASRSKVKKHLVLTEKGRIPDGWFTICTMYDDSYGNWRSVSCWATTDHRVIVVGRAHGCNDGYDADGTVAILVK